MYDYKKGKIMVKIKFIVSKERLFVSKVKKALIYKIIKSEVIKISCKIELII